MPSKYRKRCQTKKEEKVNPTQVIARKKMIKTVKTRKNDKCSKEINEKKNNGKKILQKNDSIGSVVNTSTVGKSQFLKSVFRRQFKHRVQVNFTNTIPKTLSRLQFLKAKWRVQKLVQSAWPLKRQLFIKALKRLRTLDSLMFKFEQNIKLDKHLSVDNFCDIFGGKWQHTSHSERFYHDEMYSSQSTVCLAVRESGRCYQIVDGALIDKERRLQSSGSEENSKEGSQATDGNTASQASTVNSEILSTQSPRRKRKKKKNYKWTCTRKCNIKKMSCSKLKIFISQYNAKRNARLKMKLIYNLDRCPFRIKTGKMGHSIACLQNKHCNTVLHHMRMLAAHQSAMRNFVKKIYFVRSPINLLEELNACLLSGTVKELEQLLAKIKDFLEGENIVEEEEEPVGTTKPLISFSNMLLKFGDEMAVFETEVQELPTSVCVSCRRTNYKKQVKKAILAEEVNNDPRTAWAQLFLYLTIEGRFDVLDAIVLCIHCFSGIKRNSIPPRSVLNGMDLDPIPSCLQHLQPCEVFALQHFHPFKVLIRLQTKRGMRKSKELVKALKGKVIYLPVDLHENIEQLGISSQSSARLCVLVNGVPTKSQRIWQELMNIPKLQEALLYLKAHNKHYANIDIELQLKKNLDCMSETLPKGQFKKISKKEKAVIYENFTVQPLDAQQVMGDTLQLYQMEKTTGSPMSVFTAELEEKVFAFLFPCGRGGRLGPKTKAIGVAEYQTTRLFGEDSRFRLCHDYIFHLLWVKYFGTVCHAISHTLRTGTTLRHLSVQQLMNKVELKDEILESSITNMFALIRGTKSYWNRQHSELQCMLFHFGPPTWFVTFSCAEYSWPDLIQWIKDSNVDVPGIDKMTPGELCAMDPVLVSRFFNKRFSAILHFILNKNNPPLGEVVEYFWRKEYQLRGMPHIHMLLWVKDSPQFGKDKPGVIMDFIQRNVTCDIPSEAENDELRELVLQFQNHKCGQYCLRHYTSKGRHYTKCRFGFPRPEQATGQINDFMSSVRHKVTKKSPKNAYSLRRAKESKNINDYCAILLFNWKANMDIQMVADKGTVIARYVTGYITKSDKGHAEDFWKGMSSSKSVKENLFSIALESLHHRKTGAPEASDQITGSPLIGRSATVTWLSLGQAASRKRVLKSIEKIKEMAETDPTSTDILKNNLIDTYYPDRCKEMEDMCLFEVAEHYTFRNMQPDIEKKHYPLLSHTGCFAFHKKRCLVHHYHYNQDTEDNKEKFFFCLLQLFKPWRKESELLGNCSTYEEAYHSVSEKLPKEMMAKYLEKLEEDNVQRKEMDVEISKITPDGSQDSEVHSQQLFGVPHIENEAENAMHEVQVVMEKEKCKDLNLDAIVTSLNEGQRKVYDKIVKKIEHSFAHQQGLCQCTDKLQVLHFVSGEAGTGKSFLIQALQTYMVQKTGDAKSCAITAPTGLAAHNVNGVTLHRLLMLPIEQDKKVSYKQLSAESGQSIARLLRQVHLLIIDEISMVSNLMLAFIHLRLMEVLRTSPNTPFGNKHVIVFGDLLQLTPVKGKSAFQMLTSKEAHDAIGSIGNFNLWELFDYDELIENMRQSKDLDYSIMLKGIRAGVVTDDVKRELEKRMVAKHVTDGHNEFDLMMDLLNAGHKTVALMCTVDECNTFNLKMLEKQKTDILTLQCIDHLETASVPQALNEAIERRVKDMEKRQSDTGGLERNLKLCVGARIMLRRNINVELGFVNGAMGHITSFVFQSDTNKVLYVEVQFDHIIEPAKIRRVIARFKVFQDVYMKRSQFPLCAAYAITVHKSQGLSLDSAIINVGPTVFSHGISYVALSRVKNISGLFLLKFDPSKVSSDPSCLIEYNRLRKEYAPELDLFKIPTKNTLKRTIVLTAPQEEVTETQMKKKKRTKENIKVVDQTYKLVPGFLNENGVECYCNASLQFLFEMTEVVKLMETKNEECSMALTTIVKKQSLDEGKAMCVSHIRYMIATLANKPEFYVTEQQDMQEFLVSIFTVLEREDVQIRHSLEITYIWEKKCGSCGSLQEQVHPHELFLILPIPDQKSVNFTDLKEGRNFDEHCDYCSNPTKSSLKAVHSNTHVILMFLRYDQYGNKKKTEIKKFIHTSVPLGNKKYRTTAFVVHEGNTIKSGHYVTWRRRQDYWLKCNDSRVTKETRAPNNLYNVYLLLLEKI